MSTQFDLWGNVVNLEPTEEKVERILEKHPDARGSDKSLILHLWLEEDGLADILGDDDLVNRFARWFVGQATYTESITRARRALQSQGVCLPEPGHQARREAREQAWRGRFRR